MWTWFRDKLFSRIPQDLRGIQGFLLRAAQTLWFAARDFRVNHCAERAATMAFVTVISLIPLAIVFLSFAVQFGYGDRFIDYVKGELFGLIAPDFQKELAEWLEANITRSAFSEGLTGMVGMIGLAGLLISAIAVLNTAERNFNRVWKIEGARTYIQKLTAFWVILTTSPFILVASVWVGDFLVPDGGFVESLTARSRVLAALYGFAVPVTIGFVGFTVLYYFLPSTRVRVVSAMLGGIVAAVLWELARRTFNLYVMRTTSVYGRLAVVPLFLVWIYVNWFITLWGCELVYAHQNLKVLTDILHRSLRARILPRPFVAIYYLECLGRSFVGGDRTPSPITVADSLGVSGQEVEQVARELKEAGVLLEDAACAGTYALGRAPESIAVDEVVNLFSEDDIPPEVVALVGAAAGRNGDHQEVIRLFQLAHEAHVGTFTGKTLGDLVAAAAAAGAVRRSGVG